jgi:hypothetical protein
MSNAHYIRDPEHWRKRAEEMRALARDVADEVARESMLNIAREYDRLAQRANERSGTK